MAWNGSDSGKAKARGEGEQRRKSPSAVRLSPSPKFNYKALVAGLIVVIGGGIAAWVLMRGERGERGERAKPSQIAETTPATTSTPANANGRPTAQRRGEVGPEGAAASAQAEARERSPRFHAPTVLTNRIEVAKARFEVFSHPSETELCFLATLPAGTMVIGSRDYDEEFMEDLKQAMVDRIEIKPDDPEDIRHYKESVIAMKKQIAQMLKDGEDVPKALAETRQQLQELGVYKFEIEQAIDEMRNDDEEWSDDDVDDFVKKANELLKEKGAEPFEFNKLTREIIKRNPFASPDERAKQDEEISEANEAVLAEREAEQAAQQGEVK